MKLKFLGGADEVGSLGMQLQINKTKILFDYGMKPSNPPEYPIQSDKVDMCFLTHAHIDHSGTLPWITKKYHANVIATPPTQDLCNLLLRDTLKIADFEGFSTPYNRHDVNELIENMLVLNHGESFKLDGIETVLHSSGHIPGSTMYEIKGDKNILFTGDIQTDDTYLMNGVKPIKTDVLVVESTYAGKEHEDRNVIERKFFETIDNVMDRDGIAIIPAFAVGRTQEIMLMLADKGYEVWVDGMGKKVLSIFLKYPNYLRDWKALKKAKESIHQVRRRKDREKALKGNVIITTGGMLDGGPALNYINEIKNDGKSAILLTGYQVEGTNGRMLMDERILNLYGVNEKISMDVHFFDFSAHAGHNDLVEFINGCGPETVVLCHGENREALLSDLNDYNVIMPKNAEEIILP